MCLGLCHEVDIQVYALQFQRFMPYNDLFDLFEVDLGAE